MSFSHSDTALRVSGEPQLVQVSHSEEVTIHVDGSDPLRLANGPSREPFETIERGRKHVTDRDVYVSSPGRCRIRLVYGPDVHERARLAEIKARMNGAAA